MITKTLSGIPLLDEAYGGVYSGRSLLVSGRSGSGKTLMTLQFMKQGFEQDERCLVLSTMPANDFTICAEGLGFPLAMEIDQGRLILLEYQSFVPGRGMGTANTLPPEGFDQLREIIDLNSIKRVVLDTVLPWVALPKPERLAEHVFSFVRSFDRLGVTTLMTIPKPVSSMAFRLKKALEDVVPICMILNTNQPSKVMTWQVSKYLGEKKLSVAEEYVIEKGKGLIPSSRRTAGTSTPVVPPVPPPAAPPPPPPPAPPPPPPPAPPPPPPPAPPPPPPRPKPPFVPQPPQPSPGPEEPVRFSNVNLVRTLDPGERERIPLSPAGPEPAPESPKAKLASVWKPAAKTDPPPPPPES